VKLTAQPAQFGRESSVEAEGKLMLERPRGGEALQGDEQRLDATVQIPAMNVQQSHFRAVLAP